MSISLADADKGPFDAATMITHDGEPLARVGYTFVSMLDRTVYVGIEILRTPTSEELRRMKRLWDGWVRDKREILTEIPRASRTKKRFAKFFGFEPLAEHERVEVWHLLPPS